jgi:hypothetical protein
MKQQWRVFIICVVASVFLIVHHYAGQPAFFDAHFARRFTLSPVNELYRQLYAFVATFVVLGLLPATLAFILWNDRPSEWGLALGGGRRAGLLGAFVLVAAMLPVLIYAGTLPSMIAGRPLSVVAGRYSRAFVLYEACLLLFVMGQEFFFRGFLLFGLKKGAGDAALHLQVIPYVLIHMNRPPAQAVASIPAGIALGYLAAQTGSVWYGVIVHWSCALILDYLVVYRPF